MKRSLVLLLLAFAVIPWPESRVSGGWLPESQAWVSLRADSGKEKAWDLDSAQPNVVGGKITFYIHPDGTVWESNSLTFAATRTAINSWAEPETTRIAFLEDPGRTAARQKTGDRVNLLKWTAGDLGPYSLASTYGYYSNGAFRDADILFNEQFEWSARGTSINGRADVQSVVTHEWGHAIGLDHIPLHGSTLYFTAPLGSIYFRTLSEDDKAAISAMYPSAAYDAQRGSIRGRVDVAGKNNDRAVHVVAIDAATCLPAVSTFSEPDGTYEIRGLRPGVYHVVAAPVYPFAAFSRFWRSGSGSFVPAAAATGGQAAILPVTAGTATEAPDIVVANASNPLEPNDSSTAATPISIGQAIVARIEEVATIQGALGDTDWYTFTGTEGQAVSIHVHANEIGSDVDPILELYELRQGNPHWIATSSDIRSEPGYATRIEGPNVDAAIRDLVLPATGTYLVRVRSSIFSGAGENRSFYVLMVTGSLTAPSASRTEVRVEPSALDADGRSSGLITVIPRDFLGDPTGSGASVVLSNSGSGALGPVVNLGNGTYEATLTAPSSPGTDSISVTVSTEEGTASLPDVATVAYVGPASGFESVLTADPRRIAADGAESTVVRLTPRDALGHELGSGRDVVFTHAGSGSLSPVTDNGDGTYEATLTSGDSGDEDRIEARVDGVGDTISLLVPFGFDLFTVLGKLRDEVTALGEEPTTPAKAASKLSAAWKKLDAAWLLAEGIAPMTAKSIKMAGKAAKKLEQAEKKFDGMNTVLPALRDLSLAAREAATDAIAEAEALGDPGLAKKTVRARAKVAAGDSAMEAGKHSKAVSKFRSAYTKVAKK